MNFSQKQFQSFIFLHPNMIMQKCQIVYLEQADMFSNYVDPTQELLDTYWFWTDSSYCEWTKINQIKSIESQDILNKNEKKESKHKVRRIPKVKSIDLHEHFQRIIEYLGSVQNSNQVIFRRQIKNSSRKNASIKRTSYFGVNKNGPNWQTLITINRRKTYVGTFMTEEESARAFDFYSMLLHLDLAKTNFNYNKSQALSLISEFSYLIM